MNEKSIIAQYAFRVIELWVRDRKVFRIDSDVEELTQKAACFVSIHRISDNSLRGCIGTLEPRHESLAEEIQHNAISAAENDSRFTPVLPDELSDLKVSVDVLSIPQKTSIEQLDPKKYGVIVEKDGMRRGVLLPNIEGVDSVEQQIRIVKRKANLSMFDNDELTFYRFTTTRHE
ncbi:MAG TPA: AmmeMemoRadiSam system protein A [Salinivirgaceae bacterium]|nr:AmmeMemoRadiSam system protein A [Salinivirgaceae bacterium]